MPSSEDRRGRPKTLRRSQRKRTRPETAEEFAFRNNSHVTSLAQARATFEGNSDKFVNVYRKNVLKPKKKKGKKAPKK